MKSNSSQTNQASKIITRRVYSTPTLKVYGKIGELTAGTNCKTGFHEVCKTNKKGVTTCNCRKN